MTIEEITDHAALLALIEAEQRGVVLDFWGTWCQPCRTLRPHLETLAADFASEWTIVAVHVEGNADLVERYGVQSTPTLVYLRDGTEVHRSTGAVTPSGVAAALAENRS
ncbi:MAG: thioredoxin family protein [Acidimicrobiales bacterium]